MTATDGKVVAALGQAIARRIGEPRYRIWFDGHTKFNWDGDLLVVGVPNLHFLEWLQKTFVDAVRAAASDVLGRPMQVHFTIDPQLFQAARRAESAQSERSEAHRTRSGGSERSEDRRTKNGGPGERGPGTLHSAPGSQLSARKRRWHRLSDFVVGRCNRVAYASALSIVETPGQGPNLLVLHGPVGTGKTHLLEGIYAGLRKTKPDWRTCYVTAEDFTNRFLAAMHAGKLSGFRKHFRECDVLLVDDLHFLARKRATQEEFLHTFDVLLADNKQVVITCDCHPRLADEFSPELADRLLGGAVWGLLTPDAETRLAILRAKANAGQPVSVPEDVLRHLANQLRGNVRELEGALHSLRHFSKATGRPVDLALAHEALADLFRHAVRVVQLPDIDQAVCQVLKLDSGALQSKQRGWAVSHPRMLAMFLARKHTAAAYSEIGQYFGGRNHSTAVAAEKKIRLWLESDGELSLGPRRVRVRELVELVERELLR